MPTIDAPSIDSVDDAKEAIADAASTARDWFELIGRIGWIAKGVVYALLGALFIRISFGSSTGSTDNEASQAGAMEAVAESRFGAVTLIVLSAGLVLYVLWRLCTVFLPGDWTGRALLDRGGYLVSALAYLSLLFTTYGILQNRGSGSSEDRKVEDLVKDALSVPAGRILVALAGAAVIVIGVVFADKGITHRFRKELRDLDGAKEALVDRLGQIGWSARGLSMLLIGAFVVVAAWTYDPDKAAGFDDTMRQTTEYPAGSVVVALTGLGFVAYAVFVVLSMPHRCLEGPNND